MLKRRGEFHLLEHVRMKRKPIARMQGEGHAPFGSTLPVVATWTGTRWAWSGRGVRGRASRAPSGRSFPEHFCPIPRYRAVAPSTRLHRTFIERRTEVIKRHIRTVWPPAAWRVMGSRRTSVIVAVVAVALLGVFIAVVIVDRGQRAGRTPPEGVETFEDLSRDHTPENVSYPQTPRSAGTTIGGRTPASTPSRSVTRTPSTPWSTGVSGSPTPPTCPRNRSTRYGSW